MIFSPTKIKLPRLRADLIRRQQLEGRLGAALLDRRLVLLIAAAGYGKTAALVRQLSLLPEGCATAWVKADEEDDLPRLLVCIAHALEPFDPPWRVAPEALAAQVAQPNGMRPVAAQLTNTMAAMAVPGGVIALDDVHLVADARVFEFLGILIDMLPDHWTLVIATRTEPPLALARLRVHGELADFRLRDIAFSPEEVQLLCNQHGKDVDGTLAQALYERTMGWAAGVSLSLQGSAVETARLRPGEHLGQRHLYEFLAAEVLDRMPVELRDFLIRCSVLPELTAVRCTGVTGNEHAAALLEDVERRGLFVSVLDVAPLTLRLHDLFRDFLEEQLRRLHPQELPLLLRRAADGESDHVRRINLLLRAGARAEAERVLAAVAPSLLASNDGNELSRLIELFEGGHKEAGPWLAYASGLWAWHGLEDRAYCESMRLAAEGFERLGEVAAAQDARAFQACGYFMIGESDRAEALMAEVRLGPSTPEVRLMEDLFGFLSEGYGGSPEASAAHLRNLVEQLEAGAPVAAWHRCVPRIYMLLGREGINPLLQRFARGALAAADDGNGALHVTARQLQAWLALWNADLESAMAMIDMLQTEVRWQGHPRALRLSLRRLMVTFHAMRGDRVQTREVWKGVLSDQVKWASMHPDWRIDFVAQACRFSATVDDWPQVSRMMRRIDSPRRTTAFGAVSWNARCCSARFALHERRNDDALRLLRELVQRSRRNDRMGADASVRIFLAVAELRAGDASAAWTALAPVWDAVRASGDRAGVLLAGKSSIDELATAPWGDAAPADGIQALRQWSDLARRWRSPAEASIDSGNGNVRLSAREFEVLALIAKGQSNKVIARALGLSPHTIKRHVARVLERLQVRSRREAAAWHKDHVREQGSGPAAPSVSD